MKLKYFATVHPIRCDALDRGMAKDRWPVTEGVEFEFLPEEEVIHVRKGGVVAMIVPRDNVASMEPLPVAPVEPKKSK